MKPDDTPIEPFDPDYIDATRWSPGNYQRGDTLDIPAAIRVAMEFEAGRWIPDDLRDLMIHGEPFDPAAHDQARDVLTEWVTGVVTAEIVAEQNAGGTWASEEWFVDSMHAVYPGPVPDRTRQRMIDAENQ